MLTAEQAKQIENMYGPVYIRDHEGSSWFICNGDVSEFIYNLKHYALQEWDLVITGWRVDTKEVYNGPHYTHTNLLVGLRITDDPLALRIERAMAKIGQWAHNDLVLHQLEQMAAGL